MRSSHELPASAGSSRRRSLLAALAALALVAGTLWWTAGTDDSGLRRFFYLWQTRHVLVAAAGVWLAAALLAHALSRHALFGVVAGSGAGALAVGLLEIVGLVGLVDYPKLFGASGRALGEDAVPNLDVRGVTYEDTARRWGLPSPPISFHFKTDRRGFRNLQDRAEADVYLLGDSFLVAGLVPPERTLAARLEAALGRSVNNLALIGLSVQAERDLLAKVRVPLAGRTLVHFVFEGNDLHDSGGYDPARAHAAAPDALPRGQRTFTYQLMMAAQYWSAPISPNVQRRSCFIGGRRFLFGWGAQSMRCAACERQIEPVLAALADTRRHVEQAGGRYLLVLLPDKLRVLGPSCRFPEGSAIADYRSEISRLPEVLGGFAREHGIPYFDVTPALLAAAASGRIPWFAGDSHWNADGIEAAARALAGWPALRGAERR